MNPIPQTQNATKSTQSMFDKVHINKTVERHALPYTEGGNVCFEENDLALCIKIKNSLTF